MFRHAILRPTRTLGRLPFVHPTSAIKCRSYHSYPVISRRISPIASSRLRRWYSSDPPPMKRGEVEGRIIDLLKNFDRITDATKITPSSNFSKDLGLDSLDAVEVVMAIEEEFGIEIPDKEADAIQSVDQGVDYILKQPEAH